MKSNWKIKKLGDIYSFKNGINFDKTHKNGAGILTVDVLNMYNEGLNVDINNLYRINKQISEDYLLRKNDILIVRSSVKEDGVAWATYFEESDEPITFCGFIIRGRTNYKINPKYVVYFLRSSKIRQELIKKSVKSTITNINQASLSEIQIPIPSLEIQNSIVSILDKAFSAIDKAKESAEKNLKNAKDLFESYLQSVFSSKSEERQEKYINEISENYDNKRIPITKHLRKEGQFPYYGASGIVDYVDSYIFDGDFLLVSEDGANLLARTYPIAFSINGKSWVNNHAHVLKFDNIITQRFVEYYLNSIKLDAYVSGMAQPKLNQAMLNKIPILYPPVEVQTKLVSIFDLLSNNIKQLHKIYENKLNILEELRNSLLQKAFSGELNIIKVLESI